MCARRAQVLLALLLAGGALVACDDAPSLEAGAGGAEGAGVAPPPAGRAAGVGAGTAAGAESGTAAGSAAGAESGAAAGSTAGADLGTTAGADSGTTAGITAGAESGTAAGATAGAESGTAAGSTAGATAGQMGGEEPPPAPPTLITPSAPAPALTLTHLTPAALTAGARLGDWLLVERASGSFALSPWADGGASAHDLTGLAGPLTAAAALTHEGVQALLALAGGQLYAVRPPEARPSPLSALITGPISALAAEGGGGDLWLAGADALYRWRAGALTRLTVEGLDLAAPALALGARFGGAPALWVAAGEALWAVELAHPDLRAWRVYEGAPLTHLAADQLGALWAAGEGLLYRRAPSGAWARYALPSAEPLLEVRASPSSGVAWLRGAQTLWAAAGVGEEVRFWPLASLPRAEGEAGPATEELLAALGGWGALSLGARGLLADAGGGLAWGEWGALWLTLDPAALPTPPAPTTWLEDVAPLAARRCGGCHGQGGVAHHLESREQWVAEFERVWRTVDLGQMPLGAPPLTVGERAVLRGWREGGFR